MSGRFILGTVVLLLAAAASAAETAPQGHVVVVLDCSAHMAEPLAPGGQEAEATRFAAGRDAAQRLLARLARDERHDVTLVLLGHRIADGEGQAAGPDVQVDYLRLADGKLQRVPSGLDVEIVRESRPLAAEHLDAYRETLDSLKPWGESPLWLAIERAAESAPRAADGGQTRIVLLTNGTNEQSGVARPTTQKQALAALKASQASLHVVQLGKPRSASDLAALARTAEATGGTVAAPQSDEQVGQSLLVAAGLQAPPRVVADPQVRPTAQVVAPAPAPDIAPILPDEDAALRERLLKKDVAVELTYWGEPVKDATIYLRGASFDIKYDRGLEATNKLLLDSRLQGKYVFSQVLHGTYLLDVTVNHKNRKYVIEREIIVNDNLLDPGHRLMIQIERSKDPPVGPPAP